MQFLSDTEFPHGCCRFLMVDDYVLVVALGVCHYLVHKSFWPQNFLRRREEDENEEEDEEEEDGRRCCRRVRRRRTENRILLKTTCHENHSLRSGSFRTAQEIFFLSCHCSTITSLLFITFKSTFSPLGFCFVNGPIHNCWASLFVLLEHRSVHFLRFSMGPWLCCSPGLFADMPCSAL